MKNKENMHINLLVTIDKTYLYPLQIMLETYTKNHKELKTDIYIAHASLDKNDIETLNNSIDSSNTTIHSINITEDYFEDTPVLERLPKESFYRLLAFSYLPESVDRCLYLDPDIVIRKSLLPLYNMDIEASYIAAASHTHGIKNTINKLRLNLDNNARYVNSGVMLMNIKKIREDFTKEQIFKALNDNIQKLLLGDQDLINIIYNGKITLIDEKIYNLDERTLKHNKKVLTKKKVEEETTIIHYNGKYKPWLNGYKGTLNTYYPEVKDKGPAPVGKNKKFIKSILNITKATKKQKITIVSIITIIIIWIMIYIFFGKKLLQIVSNPDLFRAWLDKFGVFDEIIFITIRALQTVIKFIPAEPLEIASGYVWGPILGMIYCIIGNTIGTIIIFVLTKKYGKKVLDILVPTKNLDVLSIIKESDKIYVLLFFLYLIPGIPKDGLTYIVAFLPVKTVPFLIISGIARIPSVISSTLCGSTLAEKKYLISVSIFVGTLVLSILGGLLYRNYIKSKEKNCVN